MVIESGEAVSSSPDGRGGERRPGQLGAKPARRYIYYRLYTKDGPLESNNPMFANDRFISRVLARSVAPPHTVALVKRHLLRIEGFEELGKGSLYPSLSSATTLEDSARLSLRGDTGPGSSEFEPMALVVEVSGVEKRSAASKLDPKTLPERREEPRFIYYRVFDKGGEVDSKTSFDEADSTLGRIDALSIPPPHTVSSLMSRLVKVEEISSPDVQLFEDEYGESVLNDDDAIALSSDHYPGIMEDEPIAIVYESQSSTSAPTIQDSESPQAPDFSKQVKIQSGHAWAPDDPAWHSFRTGDIFRTDGNLRTEKCQRGFSIDEFKCYVAINSAGNKAFLRSHCIDFC